MNKLNNPRKITHLASKNPMKTDLMTENMHTRKLYERSGSTGNESDLNQIIIITWPMMQTSPSATPSPGSSRFPIRSWLEWICRVAAVWQSSLLCSFIYIAANSSLVWQPSEVRQTTCLRGARGIPANANPTGSWYSWAWPSICCPGPTKNLWYFVINRSWLTSGCHLIGQLFYAGDKLANNVSRLSRILLGHFVWPMQARYLIYDCCSVPGYRFL